MQNKTQPRSIITDIYWTLNYYLSFLHIFTHLILPVTQYLSIITLGIVNPTSQVRNEKVKWFNQGHTERSWTGTRQAGCRFCVFSSCTTLPLLAYPRSFWSSLLALSHKIQSKTHLKFKKKKSQVCVTFPLL